MTNKKRLYTIQAPGYMGYYKIKKLSARQAEDLRNKGYFVAVL